jgi:hypothetical protein
VKKEKDMSLTWRSWISVSEGSTTPGAPVAAVPWGQSFALFLADPGGGVYAIKAEPGFGWELVPGHSTTPGAPITALASGDHFTLFMADANGEVFKTSGIPYQGWDSWSSVSEGTTTPGAPVAAVPWGQSFALFLADPGGGIYAIKAEPGFGWELVPGLNTTPGAHVTALASGDRFILFMADANGEVFRTSGIPYQGWDPWTSVSEGRTMPGAPVAAVKWEGEIPSEDSFALFLADPAGGIYAIKAEPGFGWELVAGGSSTPGAHITAVSWYKPPTGASGSARFLLFVADVEGRIYTTSGKPYQGWDPWARVLDGTSTPGAPVMTVPRLEGAEGVVLFIADLNGGVRETSTSDPPATPESLTVTSLTAHAIDVSWTESNPASVELGGFVLNFERLNGGTEGPGSIRYPGPADRTAAFTGLDSGVEYKIWMHAFNDNGYSPSTAPVLVTTPQPPPPPNPTWVDLFVHEVDLSDYFPATGETIEFTWQECIAGTGSPGAYNVAVYHDDHQIYKVRRPAGLSDGCRTSETISTQAQSGTHQITVTVDSDNEVVEVNKDNNSAYSQYGGS